MLVSEIIDAALEDIEVKPLMFSATAEQVANARRALYRMMKAWQNLEGVPEFLKASQTITATATATQTLNPARPFSILNMNIKRDGIETPMLELTRDEYDQLPDKTVTGYPTQFYYDRQQDSGTLYVWPVLEVAAGEEFLLTYERAFDDVTNTSQDIDAPAEWWDALVLGLADRLLPAYGKETTKQTVPLRAQRAFRDAIGAATAGESVYFG